MVDCEVWESGKCEERSGCEGERRTGCEGERRTGCEGERIIMHKHITNYNTRSCNILQKCTPFHTPSLPSQFTLLLLW